MRKAGVIGLGKSGIAVARLLRESDIQIEVSERRDTEELRAEKERLEREGIKVEIGKHSKEFIRDKDLLIVSPGVDNPQLFLWAKEEGVPLVSEIEVAYRFCSSPIIAITGTNGKSSAATLIGEMLKKAGKKAVVCGNIGIPFSHIVREGGYEVVVLEVSSFQLERIDRFKPYISVILNITPDHLDRYQNFEEYKRAKYRIFENQREGDWLLINKSCQQAVKRHLLNTNRFPHILWLDEKDEVKQSAKIVGRILGISKEIIQRSLEEFKGLEHRLEYVDTIGKVRFINDSKATNVDAVRYALENVSPPVILILGGKDKGGEFSSLCSLIKEKVKKTILIGKAKEKIREQIKEAGETEEVCSLKEVFSIVRRIGEEGDTVLFSPGCASFDMFANFEERGREFKKLVKEMAKG